VKLDGRNPARPRTGSARLRRRVSRFQYPVEIPASANLTLLKAALTRGRQVQRRKGNRAGGFLAWVRDRASWWKIDPKMLSRGVKKAFPAAKRSATKFADADSAPRLMISTRPIPALTSTR